MNNKWEFWNAGTITATYMLIFGPMLVLPAFMAVDVPDKYGNVVEWWHPLIAMSIIWFLCALTYIINFMMVPRFTRIRIIVVALRLWRKIPLL